MENAELYQKKLCMTELQVRYAAYPQRCRYDDRAGDKWATFLFPRKRRGTDTGWLLFANPLDKTPPMRDNITVVTRRRYPATILFASGIYNYGN